MALTKRHGPTEYERRRDFALAQLTADQREDFYERAGIMEFCGGLTRMQADRQAFRIIRDEAKRTGRW